jgi:hypothetical protein
MTIVSVLRIMKPGARETRKLQGRDGTSLPYRK